MSWRLFSSHCRGARQDRMYRLLLLMERNERTGDVTTPAGFSAELGLSRPAYRMLYAAEREGFARRVLVPNGHGMNMAYVIREGGREWLRAHEEYLRSLRRTRDPAQHGRGGARPCRNMVPLSQAAARAERRRRESLARARAGMESRRAGR